jgi:hypothetical protein
MVAANLDDLKNRYRSLATDVDGAGTFSLHHPKNLLDGVINPQIRAKLTAIAPHADDSIESRLESFASYRSGKFHLLP